MQQLDRDNLAGRYRIERLIGRGGMAEVYQAWDRERGYHVAVKVLRPDLAEDREFERRFRREADALARLAHRNIVRFYSFERDGPLAYIVMDYIDGVSLRRRIFDADGPMDLEEVRSIVEQVAAAVHYAHGQGVLHRDLKPGNIMIDPHGLAFVTDFGIARAADVATMTTVMPGTPAYMSPEQCRGAPLDARTDVYSLGVVAYEMLTGRRPFVGETAPTETGSTGEKIRWEQVHAPPPPLSQHNPDVPAAAEQAVLQALAKAPEERWSTALDFGRALGEELQPSVKATARAPGDGSPSPGEVLREKETSHSEIHRAPWFRRLPASAWTVGGLALAVLILGFMLMDGGERRTTQGNAGHPTARVATPLAAIGAPTQQPTATPTRIPSRTPTQQPVATRTRIPTATPYLAPSATWHQLLPTPISSEPPAPGQVKLVIRDIVGVGDLYQEAVVIVNESGAGIQLIGWQLRDMHGSVYSFNSVYLFGNGSVVILHSRAGDDTVSELFWGKNAAVWKPGETAALHDAEGTVRAEFTIPLSSQTAIAIGTQLAVVGTEGIGASLRAGPGTNYHRVGVIRDGETVEVIGGPEEADGYLWWAVRTAPGLEGWTIDRYLQSSGIVCCITNPTDNSIVSGLVPLIGTATHPQFLRYELAFFKEFELQGDWVIFYTGNRPVVNGVLATWDTTVGRDAGAPFFPDGTYRLRLRVVQQDANYGDHFVTGLSLANDD